MNTHTPPTTAHEGRNVKRLREILGIKQEALALDLGLSQQAVSQLEQKEALDKDLLEKIAKVLKVSPEAIKNFDEEKAIFNIQNNYDGSNTGVSNVAVQNYQCTFNPIDKWAEEIAENRKLYERLLEAEKEKMALLQKLLDKHQ